jgi:hypothetical protein
MPTQIIDASLHTTAFPPQYTGPGNLIGNCVNAGDPLSDTIGFFTSAGNAVQINVGYAPMQVDIADITGVLQWRWQLGMPANNSMKTATAAMTVDTTGAIVVSSDLAGNGQVTLSATLVGTGKVICFHVQG